MQVSDKGGQGLVAVVGMSVGGQDPKATLQRQEACHKSCQGASSLPPARPEIPPLEPLTFGCETALTYNAKEAEGWLGNNTGHCITHPEGPC